MIVLQVETVLTFAQASNVLPRRRRGRKTHASTLYRWATSGCRGVVLETLMVGATRCTSVEALQRFFDRLTAAKDTPGLVVVDRLSRTAARRQRDSERAAAELERSGA